MARSLRLRVFAGPNGSGKTTIIDAVRKARVNGRTIDFGLYINADDLASGLGKGVDVSPIGPGLTLRSFLAFAERSGLLDDGLSLDELERGLIWQEDRVRARKAARDRVAQLLAHFFYAHLLHHRQKFSFETVFSHPGKLDLMRQAKAAGYKVYLYFISTEDPDINVQRVKQIRVKQGGHDVPKDKIISRYHRTMANYKEAMELAYHAYVWDNSGQGATLFCELKRFDDNERWMIDTENVPFWFVEHYLRHYPSHPILSRECLAVMQRLSGYSSGKP